MSMPKVATVAIYDWLRRHYPMGQQHGMHGICIPTKNMNYFLWTVARNPYTRARSLWWNTVAHKNHYFPHLQPRPYPFDEFIRWMVAGDNPSPRHMDVWLRASQTIRRGGYNFNSIVLFESINEGLSQLPFVRPETLPLPPKNESSYFGVNPAIITPDLAELIYHWDQPTFEKFGYPQESFKNEEISQA